MPLKPSIKVGDVFQTNNSGKCIVVEYANAKNIVVKFIKHDYVLIKTLGSSLKAGRVENPYYPSVYNKGFVGKGKYKPSTHKKLYTCWTGMYRRCYDPVFQSNNPTYVGCKVHKNWHNFQQFCEWAIKQPNFDKPGFCLDKDLRKFGNKMYSPSFCSFVPNKINVIFSGSKVGTSKFPGVWYNAQCIKPYYVRYNKKNYYFSKSKSAFKFHLKLHLKYISKLANKFKSVLHKDIYSNLTDLNEEQLGEILFLFYKERRS